MLICEKGDLVYSTWTQQCSSEGLNACRRRAFHAVSILTLLAMTSGYAPHFLPHTEAAATLLADTGCSAVIEGANSPCTKAVSLTVVGVDSADVPRGRGALVLQDGVYRKKLTVATKAGGKTLDEWQT